MKTEAEIAQTVTFEDLLAVCKDIEGTTRHERKLWMKALKEVLEGYGLLEDLKKII